MRCSLETSFILRPTVIFIDNMNMTPFFAAEDLQKSL